MFGYPLSGVIISICKKGLEFNFVQKSEKNYQALQTFKSEKKQILFNFFHFSSSFDVIYMYSMLIGVIHEYKSRNLL